MSASTVRLPMLPARPTIRMGGAGSALLLFGTFMIGLVLLLLINTVMAQNSFILQQAEQQATELENREQLLLQQVTAAQSPEALQRAATRLGMVPVAAPVFLRLADGKVLGKEIPAEASAQAPTGGRGPLTPADPVQSTPLVPGVPSGAPAATGGTGAVSAPTTVSGSANAPTTSPVAATPKPTVGKSAGRTTTAPPNAPAKPVKKPTATKRDGAGTARTKGNPPPTDANLTETNRP